MLLNVLAILTPKNEIQLFDGTYSGFQRYDYIRYPRLDKLFTRMRGDFWIPQEINMMSDSAGIKQLPSSVQEVFRANLLFQTCADSLVTRGVHSILAERASDPVMEKLAIQWSYQELIHCYDDDTDILTDKGFIPIREVNNDTVIANWHSTVRHSTVRHSTVRHDNVRADNVRADNDCPSTISYCKPSAIMRYHYKGDMIRFESGKIDLLVTPNHKVGGYSPDGCFETSSAQDADVAAWDYPINGNTIVSGPDVTPLERLALGYFARRNVQHNEERNCYKFVLKSERKKQYLRSLINAANLEYTEDQNSDYTVFRVRNAPFLDLDLSWVRPSTRSARWCESFLEELRFWNAFKAPLWCGSKGAALEVIKEVSTLVGMSVDYTDASRGLKVEKQETVPGDSISKSTQGYDGEVHCVSVPSGFVIVRRNGKISVSGNSDSYSHIIRSVYSDPSGFFDSIADTPAITSRFSAENAAFTLDGDIEDMLLNLLALEAGKFMMSFLFTYLINENYPSRIPGSTQIIRLINNDENNHMLAGAEILKIIRKAPREAGLKESRQLEKYAPIFNKVLEDELQWGEYLHKLHPFVEINRQTMEQFMRWCLNRGLKAANLPVLPGTESTTLSKWFLNVSSINKASTAAQETELTSYTIGKMVNDWQ